MTVLAEAEGLAAGYAGRPVVSGISFRLEAGQRLALLGPNGGGKTTLLRVLLGELEPLAGELAVNARCGTVPQSSAARLDFPVSALDVATMGSLSRLAWWRRPGRAERDDAGVALGRVGMADRAETTFGELSAGQRQRTLIARGLVQGAGLMLLDEPFTGVDRTTATALEALIAEIASEGKGVVIATHDLDQARRCDLVLCLNGAQIAFGPPGEVLTRDVLERTYGGAIIEIPGGGAGILPADHCGHG